MFKKLKLFWLWLSYRFSEIRNVYSHKAVGQCLDSKGNTLIMFTILGKRDLYKLPISDLMEDKSLVERFHPCQAAKFGAIALGEVIFNLPENERESRYKNIKTQMIPPSSYHDAHENSKDQKV